MNEIKCPNCGKVFQIDESSYESIVKQIRDQEFEKEISTREKQYQNDKESAIKLAESKIKEKLQEEISKLNIENINLKNKIDNSIKEKEIAIKETTNKIEKEYNDKVNSLEKDNNELKNNIKLKETENKLEIEKALSSKDKIINDLENKIKLSNQENELEKKKTKENYDLILKQKDETIEFYKDMKLKQSTKMVGETLEQHCSIEFERIRPLFKNAEFGKDNDVTTGSKGDFIFRDFDDEGNEIVSIMFEMKNENDETSTKHKNKDFFKELDKDRREKKCEYAVLVSLLEIDNELYNNGITDVSHEYEKMYVIRPQLFVSIITLIRSAALKSLDYKKQLIIAQNTSIDISNFEENLNTFKEGFSRNYRLASENFSKAIEEIDKTIDHLNKVRENLLKSDNNLRLANNKAEDLTIKKLTHNSPSMKEKFDELKDKNNI